MLPYNLPRLDLDDLFFVIPDFSELQSPIVSRVGLTPSKIDNDTIKSLSFKTDMCIAFLSLSSDPKEDGYKVIIAFNRDEYFDRPTQEAHFWKENPDIISGEGRF